MLCQFCDRDNRLEKFFKIGELSFEVSENDHLCHCIYQDNGEKMRTRIAWGICCAKFVVGKELMAEEDFHDKMEWSHPEDCKCDKKVEQN